MGGDKLTATPWVGREQRELVLSRADRSLHNARAEWRGQFCAVFVLQCRQREPAADRAWPAIQTGRIPLG